MTARPLVELVRNGVVESVHAGHLAVVDASGAVLAGYGAPEQEVYARSAVKPFQAAAIVELAAEAGIQVDLRAAAIAAASHAGAAAQQVEAARLLALAGLDERALGCPEALPSDVPALLASTGPSRLAHNCSGKHAGFLLAHVATGGRPERYLRRDARVQRLAARRMAEAAACTPSGPGVDGCGAPAWRLPLTRLALAFARLAGAAHGPLGVVRQAMQDHPDLVGAPGAADTELMLADAGVVAKRGAEGVLAAGVWTDGGPLGVAVKIADGGARAAAPAVAAVLDGLGVAVPRSSAEPSVMGGGRVQGGLRATDELQGVVAAPGGIASG